MSSRHPSRGTLLDWLMGISMGSDIDAHIDTCSRCAAELERLDATELPEISGALSDVLAAPPDLTDRLEHAIAERLSLKEMLGIFGDLFSAGYETSRLLFVEDDDDNH